jgi:RNA polymerase sigma-70 factor (ECF subfamily)
LYLQTGDRAAFTELYNRFWPLLYRHARKMLRNDEDALDLIQELFTSIWEKRGETLITGSVSGFLYRATKNRVFNFIKKDKAKLAYIASIADFIEKGEFITDQTVLERELAKRIENEISLLPRKMREIFEFSRKENLSYKEIAEKVNVTEGTVKKQVHNAIKLLKLKFDVVLLLSSIFLK